MHPGQRGIRRLPRPTVSWEEYNRDVGAYAEQAGIPVDPVAFVAALKTRLAQTANVTDSAFPDNEHVEIVSGGPVVKRLCSRDGSDGTAFLERLLKPRMVPVGVLQALADTEDWLGWTRDFGPVSGFEAKLERPRERYHATKCSRGGARRASGGGQDHFRALPAYSDDVAQSFRLDVAHRSDLMSPTVPI